MCRICRVRNTNWQIKVPSKLWWKCTFLLDIYLQSIKCNYAICQWQQPKLDCGSGLRWNTSDQKTRNRSQSKHSNVKKQLKD